MSIIVFLIITYGISFAGIGNPAMPILRIVIIKVTLTIRVEANHIRYFKDS